MQIKGLKKIQDYKYLVMFDLASRITGVCLWDIENQKPISTDIIKVSNNCELPVKDLYNGIDAYFANLKEQGINLSELFVSYEAVPSQIRSSKGSTIQTFVALAKSHAILDLYLAQHSIDVYDYVGIYPITTHAFFKKIMEYDMDIKFGKEDIQHFVLDKFDINKNISLDESDAVFLAYTLINSKWNRDIQEIIKDKKRHLKTLKQSYAIDNIKNEINCLELLKI